MLDKDLTNLALGFLVGAAALYGLERLRSHRKKPKFLDSIVSLFDHPGMACAAIDPASSRLLSERRLKNLFAIEGEPSYQALLESLREEDRPLIEQLLQRCGEGREPAPVIVNTRARAVIEITPLPVKSGGHCLLGMKDISNQHRHGQLMQNENEALKTDVRRYSLILNSSEGLVWLRNEQLDIVYCNTAYAQIADIATETSSGVPELHSQGRRLAEAAIRQGKPQREQRHLVIGGERRFYTLREVPMPDGSGVIGFALDMTEVEEAHQETDRHIAAQADLLESSTSAMAIFGADMRLRIYNHAYVAMGKFDESWLDSKPTHGEILEHLREKRRLPEQANFRTFKDAAQRLFTDLLEPQEEFYYLPDGRTLRVVAIPHAMGGLFFTYEDVTDRLALERSYNTLIAVQKETLDNLHEGVVVFGENGRLQLFNPSFMHLWQLESIDLPEQIHLNDVLEKLRVLMPHEKDGWDLYKRGFIARTQSRALYATHLERTDQSLLNMTVVPLPDGGTLLTFTDITDTMLVERSLRERNDALQAADRLKTEFLANVSYELRSPLTSISGFSEMLRQDYFGDLTERQREYVEGIHESSQHLMHLINDILDLASIEAGYMTLEIRDVNIPAMLKSVMALLNERMKRFSITAVLSCPEDIGTLQADETRLRQVLFHLLSNAVKYSPEDGEVTLGARAEGDSICLWVSDQGSGISEEEQRAVFDKFYRGGARVNASGTGLGLSMVKSFIELHGGKVVLDSSAGNGTTVNCILPVRTAGRSSETEAYDEPAIYTAKAGAA